MVNKPGEYDHCRPDPPIIHGHKDDFDPSFNVPLDLNKRLREIYRLDHELGEFILRSDDYTELVKEAWDKNFHASTGLEGNPLDLDEVRRTTKSVIEGESPESPEPPVQEIINHMGVMLIPSLFEQPWSVQTVKDIHAGILHDVDPSASPGELRTSPGRKEVLQGDYTWFKGANGERVEGELERLMGWLATKAPGLATVVAGALFFHEFESIHPFEDGNGRTGRVLFHTYLRQNGLENVHKCLIEHHLTENPDLYYRVLGWADQEGDYKTLIDYFTESVLLSYQGAVERFSEKDLLSSDIDEVDRRILIKARDHGDWFKAKRADSWVNDRSRQTILNRLNYWVDREVLETKGKTRAKRYRYIDPIDIIQERVIEELQGQEGVSVSDG